MFPLSWYAAGALCATTDAHIVHARDSEQLDHMHFAPDVLALVDFGGAPGASTFLEALRRDVASDTALYAGQPTRDVHRTLRAALTRAKAPAAAAALLATVAPHGVLRVAAAGACGLIVVRDDDIAFRSYARVRARDALEAALAGGGRAGKQVCADFFELRDSDLLIAGSDGLFANLSEQQILAFVRPVPDPLDATLSIANNTCLGSWTHDDPTLIAYHLAHLAHNFSEAPHSKPLLAFPFPPSPHVDDVSVIVAAFEYQDI